jgi:chromate transporter
MREIDPPRASEIDPLREKVSPFELAWTFNHIALASFGGGLSAWSREVLVVEKQWMGEAEFLSAMTTRRGSL